MNTFGVQETRIRSFSVDVGNTLGGRGLVVLHCFVLERDRREE